MGRVAALIAVAGMVAAGVHVSDARAALGPAPVTLGAAGRFGVLAGTTVTSIVSAVGGDLGVSPGIAITGFPPSTGHWHRARRRSHCGGGPRGPRDRLH